MRLCRRWSEPIEGKPKLSTWQSFKNWLEKEAKNTESNQRWMPDKKEWKRSDSSKGDGRKITGRSGPGLFAGATGEHPSRTEDVAKNCPIHKSHHTFQECHKFEGMSTSEKENLVGEHNLCLSFLLPGHRLSQYRSRNRCTIENCEMRHHTLVHEVDLKFIERARAKHQQERVAETVGGQAPPPHQEGENAPQNQAVREQYYHSAYSTRESGGRALVEALPVIIFGETGTQQVMALSDSSGSTTLIEESLALTLGLKGREIDLEI